MIFMFCGSSSTRQFSGNFPGKMLVNYYSGATIKGLANEASRENHANIISHISSAPENKRLFLMLGNADYDFTYYRYIYDKRSITNSAFIEDRALAYNIFLERLITENEMHGTLKSVHVLAPQISPILDRHFVRTVSLHAKMDKELFAECIKETDCTHATRVNRTVWFNDVLEDKILKNDLVKFHRIDRVMLDEKSNLKSEFYPKGLDHHAEKTATFRLWRKELRNFIPAYERAIRREVEARKKLKAALPK